MKFQSLNHEITMKTILRLFCALCVLAFNVNQIQAAPVDADESGFQLTIELRDGSRVVGKSLEDTLSFHSTSLGDMKLSWAGIRSIEYAADTDTARLTATNGDEFTIQLVADTLRVETGFGKTELPVKFIRSIKVTPVLKPDVAAADDFQNESGSRLTIELRDGSHVVGKSLDDTLNLHSSAMGDLKLAWTGIHSIEYATTNTDVARLTATNGDVYEVQFVASVVRVETSFGKNELPVKLIRSIKVSAMTRLGQLTSGMVALWSGDGNGDDSVGGHNAAVPSGITYAPGKVGQGFNFDGQNNRILVPNAQELNFGDHQDFSITVWIQPLESSTTSGVMSILDKRSEQAGNESSGYEFSLENGRIHTRILHMGFGPAGPDLRDGQFHQVALTVQRDSPVGGHLYVDGRPVLTFDTTSLAGDLSNDQPLRIGNHCNPDYNSFFKGIINQVALYNRALSTSEIQAICKEDNNGELPPLPRDPRS